MMLEGEATEGKAIRGYQAQSSNHITRQGRNRGSMAVWLAFISKSSSGTSWWPLPFCWRQDSKLDRLAACEKLSGFSHHDPDRWVERAPKYHLTPWRGQSARPASSCFSFLHFWWHGASMLSSAVGFPKTRVWLCPSISSSSSQRSAELAVSELIKLVFPPGQVLHLFTCFLIISHGDESPLPLCTGRYLLSQVNLEF